MGDKIRVAMVGRYPKEPGKPMGGPEAVGEVLADSLALSGEIEIDFITSVPGLKKRTISKTAAGVTVHLLPTYEKYRSLTRFLPDRLRIQGVIRNINPDIVHVHTTVMYAYAALERGYPSVLAIRGLVQREAPLESGPDKIRMEKFTVGFERDALRRAKNIICLNRYTSSFIEDQVNNPQIRYIDNPADDSFFEIENHEEEGRILLLAPVRRLKGHEFAVQAAAELKRQGRKIDLYMVGPALDTSYLAEVEQMMDELDVRDCVHIEGNAPRDVAREHYSKASVVLLPSLIENAPLVVSEGMAAGKAIVATPAGGVAEMIEDGKSGIIVPMRNGSAIADAVGKLLDSPEMRSEMGRAARQMAENRVRKEVSVQKTIAFYKDILGLN